LTIAGAGILGIPAGVNLLCCASRSANWKSAVYSRFIVICVSFWK
jgi:hypothetical protein